MIALEAHARGDDYVDLLGHQPRRLLREVQRAVAEEGIALGSPTLHEALQRVAR